MSVIRAVFLVSSALVLLIFSSPSTAQSFKPVGGLDCNGYSKVQKPLRPQDVCADFRSEYGQRGYDNGHYVGHDEPSVGFISTVSHSGNNLQWEITLPRERPLPATQSFENFVAFWFAMALCDPNSGFVRGPCIPDSDENNPNTAGSAFLEMQFFPPGEIGHFTPGAHGDRDGDDAPCFPGPTVAGCLGADVDFDGTSYLFDWPDGTRNNATSIAIRSVKGSGIGPLSAANGGHYERPYPIIHFETDVAASEATCQPDAVGCVVPPRGAKFYPFFALATELDDGGQGEGARSSSAISGAPASITLAKMRSMARRTCIGSSARRAVVRGAIRAFCDRVTRIDANTELRAVFIARS
jgi:hypothetical protein